MSTQSAEAAESAGRRTGKSRKDTVIKLFVNGQSREFELTDDLPMLRLSTKGSKA
jgi:hypothetical protein